MDVASVIEAAGALFEAASTGVPIEPLTANRSISAADAYRIQLYNIDRHLTGGRTIRGHKVGLSSRAMQQMLGVDEPDYGHLLDTMFEFEESELPVGRFIQPRVEIEVAFVLGRRLVGPGVSVADVIRATEFVLPAIEIVDSRIVDWNIGLADTIADNASSGAVVLGGSPRLLHQLDVRTLDAALLANGKVVEQGSTGAVLGNPAVAVAWLANKVAAFGVELEEGHVIMPGSCTRMIAVSPGDVVEAKFEHLGHVRVSFSKGDVG